MYEQTLVILKPDAVNRGLTGAIFDHFIKAGFSMRTWDFRTATPEEVLAHYAPAIRKYENVPLAQWSRDFFGSGQIVTSLVEAEEAVQRVREFCGEKTDPTLCSPASLRGMYGIDSYALVRAEGGGRAQRGIHNIVHSSENREDRDREIPIWYPRFKRLGSGLYVA